MKNVKEYCGFEILSYKNGNYHFYMTDVKKKEMEKMYTNEFQFEIEKCLNACMFIVNQVNGYIYLEQVNNENETRLYSINTFYEFANKFNKIIEGKTKKIILRPMKKSEEKVIKINMANGY